MKNRILPSTSSRVARTGAGFTLIELLLVITILGFIASSSFISLSRFSKQQGINVAYENLKNDLNEAKSKASSQVVKNCANILVGYEVTFNSASTPKTYRLWEVCKTSAGVESVSPVRTTAVSLPSGVSFVGSPSPIRFLTGSGGAQTGGTITLTNNIASQDKSITVYTSGVIK